MPLSADREIFKTKTFKPRKPGRAEISASKNLYGVDLSFNGHETQHATHSLHPYVAAINPPLARALIETYIPENENVLDPYCGGGGVLVEAILAGRSSAGGEINPLGVILSKAKTTHIPADQIERMGQAILQKAKKLEAKVSLNEADPSLHFWFKEKQLKDVVALSKAFRGIEKTPELETLFQAILSGTIRDVMLTYRGEIRLRKLRGPEYDRFDPNTFEVFRKRYTNAAAKVSALPSGVRSDIANRDIRYMPFEDQSFYGIVCSPPYADDKNGVGYFQFSKNMLSLLGFSAEEVKRHREMFLGTLKANKEAPISASLESSLRNVAKEKPEKYAEAVAFYSDYNRGLSEMVRVVRERIIIVVGNRVLARTEFDNAVITVELLNNYGVKLDHHYTRELKKKRIANLGGDGGGINLEHILVFKK